MLDLYLVFTQRLDMLGIRYMVSGSVAAMYYGEPRLTNDVDIIVWVTTAKVPAMIEAFPLDTFYCPPADVILKEINRSSRGHSNIIHHETGFKADLYFVKNDPLHLWGLSHVNIAEFDGNSFKIAPPEYVIIRKLEFYQEGGSEKHLNDVRALLKMTDDIDLEFVIDEVRSRGLSEIWKLVKQIK